MRAVPEPPKRDTQALTRSSPESGNLISPLAVAVVAAAGAAGAGVAAAGFAASFTCPLPGRFADSVPRGVPFAGFPFAGFDGAGFAGCGGGAIAGLAAAAFAGAAGAGATRSGRGMLAPELLRRARSDCVAERTCSGEIVVTPARAARRAASSASRSIARGTPNVAPWMSRHALRENIAAVATLAAPVRW